jgi:hypothetical protein
VADDLVPVLERSDGDLRVELDRLNDGEEAAMDASLPQDPEQAPSATRAPYSNADST